ITAQIHQAFKQSGHIGRIVTGVDHGAQTDVVGFGFVLTGETQLVFDRAALGSHNSGRARTAAAAQQHNAGEQGGKFRKTSALGILNTACEVTLTDVCQVVRYDRGGFARCRGVEEEAAVNPDNAARSSKSVQCRAIDNYKGQPEILQVTVDRKIVGEVHHVIV